MTKLEKIEASYKGSYEFGDSERGEWANSYGALLIRAVRQLGPYAVVAAQRDIAVGNTIDPDVLDLIDA